METKQLKDKWPELRDKLLETYPQLSANDLVYEIGQEAELLKRLQEKLGKNRKEIDYVLSLMG
ncbi:MAG: general stress protein CsbD [Bacteroidetes bacterium]|nr:general stress protein CsbD [Bacteroidota bacterium]